MRRAVVPLVALTSAPAWAQELKPVLLGRPQFVAKNVKDVFWSPTGRALAYTTETKEGLALGAFDLDEDDGKILYRFGKGESIKGMEWLPSGKRLMIFVGSEGSTNNFGFGVVDATAMQYKALLARQFPTGEVAEATFFTSPLLDHALVDITTSKGRDTWVLLQNATGFAYSRDIAAAEAQGQSYLGWSSAGTALYGIGALRPQLVIQAAPVSESSASPSRGANVTIELSPRLVLANMAELSVRGLDFNRTVPRGSSVLECVPGNGFLRPVKYSGHFEAKSESSIPKTVFNKMEKLTLGSSTTESRSLWLVDGNTELELVRSLVAEGDQKSSAPRPQGRTEPRSGQLVSAQADAWWTAPRATAIAFTWNGVLFVRSVTKQS